MEKSALKTILISLLITISLVLVSSCDIKTSQYTYVVVTSIEKEVTPKQVLVTESTNKALKGGAKGALLGAGASYLLGGSIMDGALLGGGVGVATSGSEETISYYETRFDTKYIVHLSDSTTLTYNGYNPYKVGESVRVAR